MKSRNLIRRIFSGSFMPCLLIASALLMISFTGVEYPKKNPGVGESSAITDVFLQYEGDGAIMRNRDINGIDPVADYVRWKGEFQYRLEYRDGLYEGSSEFLKMKGLRGETSERIEVTGHVVFTQAKKKIKNRIFSLPGHFAGKGTASYTIARMSLSRLGEAQVVHFTDGKGNDQIKRNRNDTYLKINRARNTYSIRITPGSYEADIDAFGVKVLRTTEMKATRAFIEKMESEERPVLYPEELIRMFPEYDWSPDRDHVVVEAFDIPLPRNRKVLEGSYKDEKGGVLSWKFVAF